MAVQYPNGYDPVAGMLQNGQTTIGASDNLAQYFNADPRFVPLPGGGWQLASATGGSPGSGGPGGPPLPGGGPAIDPGIGGGAGADTGGAVDMSGIGNALAGLAGQGQQGQQDTGDSMKYGKEANRQNLGQRTLPFAQSALAGLRRVY